MTDDIDLEREKLNLETSQIPWAELQRFFAQGLVIYVSSDLDLVEVADAFAKDQSALVKPWADGGKVAPVSDDLAKAWFEANADVWAVVVRPWILVQSKNN